MLILQKHSFKVIMLLLNAQFNNYIKVALRQSGFQQGCVVLNSSLMVQSNPTGTGTNQCTGALKMSH